MQKQKIRTSIVSSFSSLQRDDNKNLIIPEWMYDARYLIILFAPVIKVFTPDNIDLIIDEVVIILKAID